MPGDPFYKTEAWQRLRTAALQRDRYRCCVRGCPGLAGRVDHIVPRRQGGADTLDNLRCFCATHDNQVKEAADGKRRSDGTPYVLGCDARGQPLDPNHWWKISQR